MVAKVRVSPSLGAGDGAVTDAPLTVASSMLDDEAVVDPPPPFAASAGVTWTARRVDAPLEV